MQVQFHKNDDLLAMVKRVEETFTDLQPIFCRKVKFMDMMIMKGEKPLAWAMRIDEEGELANLQRLKAQELKLMKFCQGLKAEDRLYDLIIEMDPRGWEDAKVIIRKHTAVMALKADLVEHRPRGSGHMVNSISGAPRFPSQSPVQQRKKYNNENRGRNRTPHGKGRDSSQGRRNSRNSSNTRLCYNCDKITTHFAATCPKPKKEEGKVERRSITPYPKSGDSSRDRGAATQGGDTYRMLKASLGEEPMVEKVKDAEKEKGEEEEISKSKKQLEEKMEHV